MRSNYWSNSKLADAIRGTVKPNYGTGKEWREWDSYAKNEHPIRFWLVETALDAVQDFVNWPSDKLHDIRYYISNRWISKTHQLTANPKDIKPGDWCDVGCRFLPCLFNELVDFVEIELASDKLRWMEKEERKKYKTPGFFANRTWRSRELGMEYLAWASELRFNTEWGVSEDDPRFGTPTPQALNAREIRLLYLWWTEVYSNRPDPYEVSGFSAYNRLKEEKYGFCIGVDETEEEREFCKKTLTDLHDLEQVYQEEDTEMLIRLIKVRDGLWT